MSVKLTYRKEIKRKNNIPSKYKYETGVALYNYRDEQGNMKQKVVRYRKRSKNNVSDSKENK